MGRTACTKPQCLYKGDLYLYFIVSENFSFLTAYDMYLLCVLRMVVTALSLSVMAYRKHMKAMLPRFRYR